MTGWNVGRRAVLGALAGGGAFAAGAQAVAKEPLRPPAPLAALPAAWPAAEVIPLWTSGPPGLDAFRPAPLPAGWPPVFLRNTSQPALHVFRPETPNGHALLVIPGGGYEFVSVGNEGVEVAGRACPLGYSVFVLNYRLPAEGWRDGPDVPLQDAQRAIRMVKALAPRFGAGPERVSVLGFSAGGHLAACLATLHGEPVYAATDQLDRTDARPAATALVYPVVTMTDPHTHAGSRRYLLGDAPPERLVLARSPERHVGPATPPLFLAHAIDDPAVPVENSLMMLAAARAAARPVEAHLFQEGGHAFGVGFAGTPTAEWIELLHLWLQRTLAV